MELKVRATEDQVGAYATSGFGTSAVPRVLLALLIFTGLDVHASRLTCSSLHSGAQIRNASMADIPALMAVENKAWGVLAADPSTLADRMSRFKEGQFVRSELSGDVSGFLNTVVIDKSFVFETISSEDALVGRWEAITRAPAEVALQNADGERVLFLINLTTLPMGHEGTSRSAIAASLIDSAKNLAKRMGIKQAFGLTRINGFRKYVAMSNDRRSERATCERYLADVLNQKVRDPALSFHLKQGAKIAFPVPKSMLDDDESLGWGVLIYYDVKQL
ncbi:MAG: hypothetical protein C5B49_01205 [Bdellovibrio sp.]|nr:MAG: hypothetical protein C5B49_01205 [Bdellovibrio sp.]